MTTHIDILTAPLLTEGDVEHKVVAPLLVGEAYLRIPPEAIHTKEYLAPTLLDKVSGKTSGYYPDFSIWLHGFVILIVEVKAPGVPAEVGYREASLYARHINQKYPTGLNPTHFLLATNGDTLLFGFHDSGPTITASIRDLNPGTFALEKLQSLCGATALETHARSCLASIHGKTLIRPFNLAGGQALLNSKKPLNTFAADLSPVLRRYFSSTNQENIREIAERAYVSSAEVTEYDRVLEALLKERLLVRRDPLVQGLTPTRRSEPRMSAAITEFSDRRPEQGQLQIVQGGVGAGKSLFIRRYKELLQPDAQRAKTYWAFIDLNTGPSDLAGAERWLCSAFIDSISREHPLLDLTSNDSLRRIFSRNLQRRKGVYDEIARASHEQSRLARANDLAKWQDDPIELAQGISQYILGNRREVLIAVMDNVDRLDLKGQLDAFQLSLWFLEKTRAFVILQMRDETYERFKNKKPLDTFRSGITFHISPPRFVDVVKRRLELSLEFLARNADEIQTYTLESGARIVYPKSELGIFLRELYIELFERKRNISRVLEALSGRDVRRALERFVSIITSGHLSETSITSLVRGFGAFPITEHSVLKILMRTEYRFFSEHTGFIYNIFDYDDSWDKPDNFIVAEILYWLARNRKKLGQIGLEGFFTCRHVANELQRQGYVPSDILAALNCLLAKQLIEADHMNFTRVAWNDCVRIQASGFIHVRVLSERLEYLYGIIATVPISDETTARVLQDFIKRENVRGDVSAHEKLRAVNVLYEYLKQQKLRHESPFLTVEESGASYVLERMASAIAHFKDSTGLPGSPNVLDIV
jgi:hypothetical protein